MIKFTEGSLVGPYKMKLIKRLGKNKGIFECSECGQHYETYISMVSAGGSRRCPACFKEFSRNHAKEIGKKNRVDITNKRYGKLIALYPTDKRRSRSVMWYCQCDCGGYAIVPKIDLECGNTVSCGCIKSKGEEKITKILNFLNISYDREKTFNECLSPKGNKLKFDFYLPDYDCCIEYDGEQHFLGNSKRGFYDTEKILDLQNRDSIKTKYCETHGIYLIRIPYTDYDILNTDYLKEKLNVV